ncbi:MAG: 50S ribosomal protein L10 [Patescibacteria group bacterium]
MKKQEKSFFVDNLAEELKDATGVVLINYSGMDVKSQQKLKKELKEADAKMIVVKNTLLKLAGEKAGIDKNFLEKEILEGQNALVISTKDPITPISVLGKFLKENESPKLRVGIVDGSFQDTKSLEILSTLPGKDILMGQVLGSLLSSLHGLTTTLNTNLQNLVSILDQKSKSK